MRSIYNVLWYFPFLGFLIAIYAAMFGLVCYIVIFLIPVGKGMFQLAKFYTAPFSFGLVRMQDYRPEEAKSYGALGVLMLLFWLPISLVFCITLAIPFLALGMSVVLIPAAITIGRSFGAVLNPIGVVCVPLEVAEEVERRRAQRLVDRHIGT